jgi:putative protease
VRVELLAPAGDFKTALAAFEAGADAVYCGLADFSARAFAVNFTMDDLAMLLRYSRAKGKKVYVAFNTLVDEDDFEPAARVLSRLAELKVDALIVQDIGVARFCREHYPELQLHASTQLVAHNLEGVLELKAMGFKRIVLARELSVEEVASIVKRSGDLEFECFIHGALCYSISGLCLFSAMEKNRSGNRGKCAYCCRLPWQDEAGGKSLAFSMRDLRLGEDVRKLVDAGVVSLKIEGRMKSDLYVASAVSYYRRILDGEGGRGVTVSDLETVFSRRTTKLYLDGRAAGGEVIDSGSLGHLGAPVGKVKKVTRDRDGIAWLRLNTSRALEKHDGLQFDAVDENGKHFGMGIGEMRQAISRRNVFEVERGSDVEIRLPENDEGEGLLAALKPGMNVYCSSSQAVRRMFPQVSIRPSDYPGTLPVDFKLELLPDRINAKACLDGVEVEESESVRLSPSNNPDKTYSGVSKAFSKLGGTDYRFGNLELDDKFKLFAPASLLNDIRRSLTAKLDSARSVRSEDRLASALDSIDLQSVAAEATDLPRSVIKIRAGQKVPDGEWDEVVVSLFPGEEFVRPGNAKVRIALPVYTPESEFGRLRVMVKSLLRQGYGSFEASDLATLRLLRLLGVEDIVADWSLYAFNSSALKELMELGVRRFVASPENSRQNLQFLAESSVPVEFLQQQSTPLFISLTRPAAFPKDLNVYSRGKLWITVRPAARRFDIPHAGARRIDLSWDALDMTDPS